jgi:nucleotide-binding universal stress UspA family protein
MIRRVDGPVIVGIDGSPDARRALHVAAEIALGLQTRLVVIHAVGLTSLIRGRRVISEHHHDEIAAQFASWCEPLEEIGIDDWEPLLRHGAPVDTLLTAAQVQGASLIVVGRHGMGRRPELLLGSTAHQIAERSPCATLIIPPVGTAS